MRRVLAVASLLTACSRPIDPATRGYDVAAAERFQTEHDAQMRAPDSPLSAVQAIYVQPGETRRLALRDGKLVDDDHGPLVIGARGDAVVFTLGDEPERTVTEPTAVDLPGRHLVIGPQSGQARVVVHDPHHEALAHLSGLPWFAVDGAAIVAAQLTSDGAGETVDIATTRGLVKSTPVAGTLKLRWAGERVELTAYALGEDLFVPFTDPTNGEQTYTVGRYVSVQAPPAGSAWTVVDFNRATNPWCAYSEYYNCPIPPEHNAIRSPVRAGVQADH